MLDGLAAMRVALDAQPGEQPDAVLTGLAHRMRRAAADRRHHAAHAGASTVDISKNFLHFGFFGHNIGAVELAEGPMSTRRRRILRVQVSRKRRVQTYK